MTVPSTQLKPISWEWLGGWFDGEGCIAVRRDKRNGNVNIWLQFHQHSVSGVLFEIREFLESRGMVTYYRDAQAHSSIQVSRKNDVQICLKRLSPYLRVKREHALECLDYLRRLDELQKEFGQRYWKWNGGMKLSAPKTAKGTVI